MKGGVYRMLIVKLRNPYILPFFFGLCNNDFFVSSGAANAVPDGVCRGACPLPYWGIFSDT